MTHLGSHNREIDLEFVLLTRYLWKPGYEQHSLGQDFLLSLVIMKQPRGQTKWDRGLEIRRRAGLLGFRMSSIRHVSASASIEYEEYGFSEHRHPWSWHSNARVMT